jgi:SAM-dependent methyltransferase
MATAWSSRLRKARQLLLSQGAAGLLEEVAARLRYRVSPPGGGMSYYEFRSRDWDRRRGVDTIGVVDQADLEYDSPGRGSALAYVPTAIWNFREAVGILRGLGVRPAEFTLVDYGCGKGRVLFMALEAGFREVVGIEIAPELARAAAENVRSYRGRRRAASVHGVDAAAFSIPAGPIIAYLFNPFKGPVLEAVAENLRRSFAEQPRPMYVVYLLGQADSPFDRGAPFTMLESAPGRAIYRLEAQGP